MTLYKSVMHKLDALKIPPPLKRPILVVWTLAQDLIRCDLTRHASAMAYVSLLSLIPSLVAVFCILSLFAPLLNKGTDLVQQLRQFVLQNLASGSGDAAVTYLDQMLAGLNFSTIGLTSFGSVLVTLVLLLRQIEGALNRIWLITSERNPFKRFMYFWTFLTLGIVVIGIIVGVTSGDRLARLITIQDKIVHDEGTLGWLAGFGGGFLFFFFLYKIVPNCEVKSRWAAAGAAVASFALAQASRFYGIYVIDSKNYQTLYGALAQLPLFLMWLYICWIIILLGALISWRLQEGFPRESDEENIDSPQNAVEHLRNAQVKAMLPMLALITVYKNFSLGSGKGLCAQDLATQLRLPKTWVMEALEVLASLGYAVATRRQGAEDEGASVLDPYFPTKPADTLTLERLNGDLAQPMEVWMTHWKPDLPLNVPAALRVMTESTQEGLRKGLTLGEALRMLPGIPPNVYPTPDPGKA